MKFARNTLVWLYVNLFAVISLIVSLFYKLIKSNSGSWIQWLLVSVVVISGILNIIFAIKNTVNTYCLYRNNEYNTMRKYMKKIKLGIVPYFIVNFIFYVLLFLLLFAASRGIIIFSPIPLFFIIPIFFTYLTVLCTSCYGIGFIALINKENNLKDGKFIIHILMQVCFVLDVISTIILLIKYKVRQTSSL